VRNLQRFVNDALLSPWLTESQLAEAVEQHPRAGAVRKMLADDRGLTRSVLEDKFVAFCTTFGFDPELNVAIDGRVVDAFFREEGVIVELDSWQFHNDRATFERDRQKDAWAAATGLATVRITDDRLERAAEREAHRLRTILEARRGPHFLR
jgi:very-short-patch-repair endonuclease